jgi:uncharacterized protein YkwD
VSRCLSLSLAVLLLGVVQAAPARAADPLLAPPSVCAEQNDLDAPAGVQEAAMHCMIGFARRQSGLGPLLGDTDLDWSAAAKSDDILRCDSFSHYACGRDFTHWIEASGYASTRCWRAAENIAWGTGEKATVRSIFHALLDSPSHRANILGSYDRIGVGLQVGRLNGRRNAHVWTQHFGSRCSSGRSQRRGGKI